MDAVEIKEEPVSPIQRAQEAVSSAELICSTEIKEENALVSDCQPTPVPHSDVSPKSRTSPERPSEGKKDLTDSSDDEPWDMDDGDRVLTHKEAMEQFRDGVAELILGDPLLNDLSSAITLEEVNSLIALEHGQAITVNVQRADDIILPVVVVQNGTVLDLKKAIQGHVALKQAREDGPQLISWRYIWRTYWLYFEGQKLAEDIKKIKDYGIKNHDTVTFMKRLKQK